MDAGPAIGEALCGGFSCQLRSARRKNLQEIHFKPSCHQARWPTFASGKTKRHGKSIGKVCITGKIAITGKMGTTGGIGITEDVCRL